MISGRSDTVLASCTGHTDSPHAPAGMPCTASFLECLDCPNARALPRHLPVQVAAGRGGPGARLRGPSGADSGPSLATILQGSRSTTTREPTREVVSRV